MAESTHEAQTQTVKQPQITSNVTTLCCESCVVVKDQLIQVREELKSTRTIILHSCINYRDFDNSFAFPRIRFRTYMLVDDMCTCILSITVL